MRVLKTQSHSPNDILRSEALKGAEKFTLPIGLNTLLTPYGNNYDVLIAGSMFGILPIFIIFLIFQKYIIDGMTAGAVKG